MMMMMMMHTQRKNIRNYYSYAVDSKVVQNSFFFFHLSRFMEKFMTRASTAIE